MLTSSEIKEEQRILRKTRKKIVIVLYLQHPEKMDLLDEFETLLESADKEIIEILDRKSVV